MIKRGKFIAIEGSDGSGKYTQFKLATEYLKQQGQYVATYDFPQYSKESSYFVRQYLEGYYGNADALGAYKPSIFFALDRFQAAASIRQDLESNKLVLCNRFTASNMAHQGQKIASKKERLEYYTWIRNLEFNILGIPRPSATILLFVPAEIAQRFVDQKPKRDVHETNPDHLRRATKIYYELWELFPDEFIPVNCIDEDGSMKSIDAVHQEIRAILAELV